MVDTKNYISKDELFMAQATSINFDLDSDQLLAKALEVGFVKEVAKDKYELNEAHAVTSTTPNCNYCERLVNQHGRIDGAWAICEQCDEEAGLENARRDRGVQS